jgi:hypothetical protein
MDWGYQSQTRAVAARLALGRDSLPGAATCRVAAYRHSKGGWRSDCLQTAERILVSCVGRVYGSATVYSSSTGCTASDGDGKVG